MSMGGGMEGNMMHVSRRSLRLSSSLYGPSVNSPLRKRNRTSISSPHHDRGGQALRSTGSHLGHADESEEDDMVPFTSQSMSTAMPPLTTEEQQVLKGQAPFSVLPVAAVLPGPPPPRFDESIVDAAFYHNWPLVIELREEGISLDSRGGVSKT
jgi:hypothetical protein